VDVGCIHACTQLISNKRQCLYNITLSHICDIIVVMEKKQVLHVLFYHIILPAVAHLAPPYFATLSHQQHDFWNVFNFYTTFI
jgi:hypothetical protein